METTVSLFGAIVIIFIVHTILTHLINWMIREAVNEEVGGLSIVVMIVELTLTLSIINWIIP